jgi:hypothetical protein
LYVANADSLHRNPRKICFATILVCLRIDPAYRVELGRTAANFTGAEIVYFDTR